jgi:hypothetical protein
MQGNRLLLISRDDLLAVMNSSIGDRAFRLLSTLTRHGFHLLATAPQPDQWTGEHGSPDDALLGPNSVRKRLSDAGGVLGGVYYVRRSMLTQKHNRADALEDILKRYSAEPGATVLLSSKRNWVKAGEKMGLQAQLLHGEVELLEKLLELVEARLETDT